MFSLPKPTSDAYAAVSNRRADVRPSTSVVEGVAWLCPVMKTHASYVRGGLLIEHPRGRETVFTFNEGRIGFCVVERSLPIGGLGVWIVPRAASSIVRRDQIQQYVTYRCRSISSCACLSQDIRNVAEKAEGGAVY